jgi:hypothetical protein
MDDFEVVRASNYGEEAISDSEKQFYYWEL